MAELYEYLIAFIDFIFFQPTEWSSYARTLFGASTGAAGGVFLNTAPVVAPFFAFWTDDDLFPAYFQAATVFYFICLIINLGLRLITRIWQLFPFTG